MKRQTRGIGIQPKKVSRVNEILRPRTAWAIYPKNDKISAATYTNVISDFGKAVMTDVALSGQRVALPSSSGTISVLTSKAKNRLTNFKSFYLYGEVTFLPKGRTISYFTFSRKLAKTYHYAPSRSAKEFLRECINKHNTRPKYYVLDKNDFN